MARRGCCLHQPLRCRQRKGAPCPLGVGLALTRLGRLEQAQAIFDSLRAQPFRSSREEAIFKDRLGLLRSAQGGHVEALQLLRDAAGFFAAAPSAWTRALALADLGDALLAAGETQQALVTLQAARTMLLGIQRNGSPDLATSRPTFHGRSLRSAIQVKHSRQPKRRQRSGSGSIRAIAMPLLRTFGTRVLWPRRAAHPRRARSRSKPPKSSEPAICRPIARCFWRRSVNLLQDSASVQSCRPRRQIPSNSAREGSHAVARGSRLRLCGWSRLRHQKVTEYRLSSSE